MVAVRAFQLVAIAATALVLGACASTSSTRARSLEAADGVAPQALQACEHLTVLAFASEDERADPSVGARFAQDVEHRLSLDFGPIFQSVEYAAAARGQAGECLLQGTITTYRPGSRVARFILIGLGSASFEGRIRVTDAAGSELLAAPFDKLWAWGGIAGASKGIEDMEKETAASIAATVARARGWTPPTP
jgi:hypothetical protein